MLRVLMEKVGRRQEQMGNVGREMETLRRNQKEMLEIKSTKQNEKMPLLDSLVDLEQPRKESLSLKIDL